MEHSIIRSMRTAEASKAQARDGYAQNHVRIMCAVIREELCLRYRGHLEYGQASTLLLFCETDKMSCKVWRR
jgi:benzoyl-CoA reductase/2-hydroxyglutaryl-CoA dehydratase subunit BcrC/BadD/HgdB